MKPTLAAAALAFALVAPLAIAQPGAVHGDSGPLGVVVVDAEALVDGAPATVQASVRVNASEVVASGGRHILVTFGNDTFTGVNVSLPQLDFAPGAAVVPPTLVENETGRVKLWWDVATMSEDAVIAITPTLTVGSSEPGFFKLEAVVLVMDMNYVNVEEDRGVPLQIFTFTNVGVSSPSEGGEPEPTPTPTPTPEPTPEPPTAPTGPTGPTEPTPDESNPIPGYGVLAAVIAAAAVALARRRAGR